MLFKDATGQSRNDSICLGDYCSMFGCQLLTPSTAADGNDYAVTKDSLPSFSDVHFCSDSELKQLNIQCKTIMSK